LGSGGIYSYYKAQKENSATEKFICYALIAAGFSLIIFIVTVIKLRITNPFIYFFLLFIPFFFAGIIYAKIFKTYAENSFRLYACDLTGAALGAIASLFVFDIFGAPNGILVLAVLTLSLAGIYIPWPSKKKHFSIFYSILSLPLIFLIINGDKIFLGEIPIGNFSEKDFYYVYPNAQDISEIADSHWSIHGRSDLVQYTNQDVVKQLFIDGAAGSPMYRFNGDIRNPDQLLYNLLIRQSNLIPFFFLNPSQKNNMLVIGPGGGKEVLIGLLSGVEQITGVEINPDFVNMVSKNKDFNGGIYTDFLNIKILVDEGRHYIKRTPSRYDLIVMALPSTEQLQSIDNFAMSENYLLTIEAIQDYLKILTPEGRLIFTVHNEWELIRLITTSMAAFTNLDTNNKRALDHYIILEQDYAPTIVISKIPMAKDEVAGIKNVIQTIPDGLPSVTYLPYQWPELKYTILNDFLRSIKEDRIPVQEYIKQNEYNISPCRDDSPYFYKIKKGIPQDLLWLLLSVALLNLGLISLPLLRVRKNVKNIQVKTITLSLIIFSCIGMGFIIIEISLFQKLVLYLGSPTTSLTILLSSLLIGMGFGSYFSKKMFKDSLIKKILYASLAVILFGFLLFTIIPVIFNKLLAYGLTIRAMVSMVTTFPLGFFLGIPFPTGIQILNHENYKKYIPWMYGINGTMTVLGSVLAVIISMIFGFTVSFYIGLLFYAIIFVWLKLRTGR
jgi:SAM-dependent methyltransferase